jgi:hypothetical protein
MAAARDRLAAARSAAEQSCRLLLTPTPEILDRCAATLSVAIGELANSRDVLAAFQGDPGVLAEMRQIRSKVSLAHRLLENAAAYHSQWNQILVSMLQGYSADGTVPTTARPGRLAVEG